MSKKIFFLGGGHGGIAAFKSLQTQFSSIEVLSEDKSIINLLRKNDLLILDIADISASIGVMAGYLSILSKEFLLNKLILNVHYSLLPHLRGLHSVVWAILNADKEIGWSVHQVDEGIDSGAIFYQKRHLYRKQNSQQIMELFDSEIENNLGAIVKDIIDGKRISSTQNHQHATWVAKRNLDDCLINFDMPINYLEHFFLALVRPYPLPSFIFKNKRYEITNYSFIFRDYFCDTGRVVNIDQDSCYVKVKDGLLLINEVLDENLELIKASSILSLGSRLK